MAIEQYEKYQPYLDFIKEYAASTPTKSSFSPSRTCVASIPPA